jgi:uncharacterized protein
MTSHASAAARDFGWLLSRFTDETAGVSDAIAVSADGFLLASSADLPRDRADHLAAITSGLISLTQGAARVLELDGVEQIIIEMAGGYLFTTTISLGSSLGVIAEKTCDIGLVAYEMTQLVRRAGDALTPALVDELKNVLTV